MTTRSIETATRCAYCGHPIHGDADAPERFGGRFCSDTHAEEFVAGVRAARMDSAARAQDRAVEETARGACALMAPGQRSRRNSLGRAVGWGAPLLALVAIPLFWSGGLAATGGSLLTGLALLACPLGMYFMMRSMTGMRQDGGSAAERSKGDRHA
ncbi:MAG: hypothetical protein Q7W02_00950 [Candidatus Rokubacteria bacterium]|nr:hypothetical protein [Candidatus Rokubacteria bacterium]